MTDIQVFGDSLTGGRYGICFGRFLKHNAQLHGIDGQNMRKILERSLRYCRHTKPKVVIIQGGINDIILNNCTADIVRHWVKPIEELISQNVNVFVCTVSPVGEDAGSNYNVVRNQINQQLREAAGEMGFGIIDVAEKLDCMMSGQGIQVSPLDYMPVDYSALSSLEGESLKKESEKIASQRGFAVTLDGVYLGWNGAEQFAACLDNTLDINNF